MGSILAQVMSKSGQRPNTSQPNLPQKEKQKTEKDPVQTMFLQKINKASDDGNIELFGDPVVQEYADKNKIDLALYKNFARMNNPQFQETQANKKSTENLFNTLNLGMNLGQGAEKLSQTIGTQTATPTITGTKSPNAIHRDLKKQGYTPIGTFEPTQITTDGSKPNFTWKRKEKLSNEDKIAWLVDNKQATPEEGQKMLAELYRSSVIEDGISSRTFSKDAKGQLSATYIFKDPDEPPLTVAATGHVPATPLDEKTFRDLLEPEEFDALSQAQAEGRVQYTRVNSRNAKIIADVLIKYPGTDLVSLNEQQIQDLSEAKTRGGATSAKTIVAYRQYISDANELLKLSPTVNKDLLTRSLPIIGKSTSLASAEIAVKQQFGDVPASTYISKVLATAEGLGNAISGGQSSDYKLKLAQQLIKSGYSPEALQPVLEAHGHSLRAKAEGYMQFGTGEPLPEITLNQGTTLAPPPGFTIHE